MSTTNTFGIDYNAKIIAERDALKKCSKASLIAEYKRSHKICDVREFSKGDLVIEILRGKFGTKRLIAAFK